MLFRSVLEARGRLFSVPSESGIPRAFPVPDDTPTVCRMPAWSPDGRLIAYFTDRTGEYELALRPADGRQAAVVTAAVVTYSSPATMGDGTLQVTGAA